VRLRLALACAVLIGTVALPSPAGAVISGATTIDGPDPNIVSLGNVAMAQDGTGGLVYLKQVGGRPHVFVARFFGGAWKKPVQVDVGQNFDSAWPAIGAGNGGRLVVVWAQDFGPNQDRLFSASLDPGANTFQPPIPIDFNIDEDIATYPSVAMNAAGQAYLSYRVLPAGGSSATLPPDYVNSETRLQRYDGSFWSALSFTANRNPSVPNRTPTAENSPKVGIDVNGNGIVVFQEPDDDFIDRIYARRIFGLTIGNPLLVSPQTYNGVKVQGGADEFAVDQAGFGEAAVAFRQQPGEDSNLNGTREFVNTIAESFSANAGEFAGPRIVDGAGDAGPPAVPGPPSVSSTTKGAFLVGMGIGNASLVTGGDDRKLNSTDRLDDGSSTVQGDPVVELGGDGAAAFAWKATVNGRGVVGLRERRADGVTSSKLVSGPRGGPINVLRGGGSGLGDALFAFQQGGQQFAQIVGASTDAPPSEFAVQAPVDFVNDKKIAIAWDAARNAMSPVTYSVTVDDEDVADDVSATKLPAQRLDDGVHVIQVIATDGAGQQTSSQPAQLKIDTKAPVAKIKKRSGHRVSITLSDGGKDQTSGVDPSTVRIAFGDGKKASGADKVTHRYAHGGTYLIAIGAKDAANNRARIRKRVKV
jgi:hypothetical protein